jgi:hypothetical protein
VTDSAPLAREATLTALELIRQAVTISPGYGDNADRGLDAQMEAVSQYLERFPDAQWTAVLMLASVLASKAASRQILLLRGELGRMPSEAEIMAGLDDDEMHELTRD